jgi:hypothetical protein
VSDAGVNGETGQDSDGASGQVPPSGSAGSPAAAPAAQAKRKIRTPEEILKDIEADEAEAIKKIQERAAQRKAEVTKKTSAAGRKNAALELVDKQRNGVRLALKNDKLDDAACDEELAKIVDAGLAALAQSALLAA